MTWVPVKMYKLKGGKALRTSIVEGMAKIPTIGQTIVLAADPMDARADVRVFQSSMVVGITELEDKSGTIFKTRTGSEYYIERLPLPETKYRVSEDPWIDLGGEG